MEQATISISAEEALKLFLKAEYDQGSYDSNLNFESHIEKYKDIDYNKDYPIFMGEISADIRKNKFEGIGLKIVLLDKKMNIKFQETYSSNEHKCILNILPENLRNQIKEKSLKEITEKYEKTLPEIRFGIEESVFYGGISIKETANTFEEIKSIED